MDLLALDLIQKSIHQDPEQRPDIDEIRSHIYFWNSQRKLQFIRDISDILEFEEPSSPIVTRFEDGSDKVVSKDWRVRLHPGLLVDLNRYRKYNTSKIRDFIRVIRNKAHHYRDLPPELQRFIGDIPEGFLEYFNSKFPKLLPHCYNFCKEESRTNPLIKTLII